MDEVIYTPRFIEDYAKNAIVTHPELTNEQIAQDFVDEHGENYNEYLISLFDSIIKPNYGNDIETLEGMKDKFKEDFIKALQERDILPKDENDKKLQFFKVYLKNTKITFTAAGGGLGGSKSENFVTIDWIQTYKFIMDYPEMNFSFIKEAICTVFHELAHRFGFFLNLTYIPHNEEKFAQGVAKIIVDYFGISDEYTSYYKKKEDEIVKLGEEKRKRMAGIIFRIYELTFVRNRFVVLGQRCYNLSVIFSPMPFAGQIEAYANPMEEDKIKALVTPAMEKIQV